MLARLQNVLRQAQRGRYAVGAFNVSNLEQTQAVIQAAWKLRSPVIVNVSEKAIVYAGLEEVSALVVTMAKKYSVPIVLNLDHGHDPAIARACINAGFSGIMFDGSRWPLKKNTDLTRAVALFGLRQGIGVEGELGQVKYPSELKKSSQLEYTDPEEAARFVQATGICALAVAIGNSHVIPHDKLDFGLLKKIRARVDVPLVLHGASGTAPVSIRRAIRLGIAKINIDTDLRRTFTRNLRRELNRKKKTIDPREYLSVAREGLMQNVMQHIRLFGSAKKGSAVL